jgi:hypothetical protein
MSDTNELLRSKHAFGMEENIDSALEQGLIDAFDILFLKDKDGNPKIGWIDRDGNKIIVETGTVGEVGEDDVIPVESLPESGEEGKIYIFGEDGYFWDGEKYVNLCKPTDVAELENDIAALEAAILEKVNADEVECSYKKVKYEITDVPVGVLVDYRENEIRIMCPKSTVFNKQSVGAGGNPNSFYMTFKTYFPSENVVGYIEHLDGQVDAEILTKSSVDKYGRRFQSTWLALADYDEATSSWKYRGSESTKDGYYGYNYQIDWYNADGVMIASDSIRINLSNEDSHSSIEPSYINSAITESKKYTDEQIAAAMNAYVVVEF